MTTVFAIFEDPQTLERAQAGLENARAIPGLAPHSGLEAEQPVEQGYQGKAPLDSAKRVEGHTLEDELIEQGVAPEESRMFADALRSGAGLLIVQGDPGLLRERLIEAGAGYVSGQ